MVGWRLCFTCGSKRYADGQFLRQRIPCRCFTVVLARLIISPCHPRWGTLWRWMGRGSERWIRGR